MKKLEMLCAHFANRIILENLQYLDNLNNYHRVATRSHRINLLTLNK